MILRCDICDAELLRPAPKGIHQIRCPFDDFEFTYDNDLKIPIEKIYYATKNRITYSLEADLVENKLYMRIIEDKDNADKYDELIGEAPLDISKKINYEYFKYMFERFRKIKVMK
jgi:hypothetical protein